MCKKRWETLNFYYKSFLSCIWKGCSISFVDWRVFWLAGSKQAGRWDSRDPGIGIGVEHIGVVWFQLCGFCYTVKKFIDYRHKRGYALSKPALKALQLAYLSSLCLTRNVRSLVWGKSHSSVTFLRSPESKPFSCLLGDWSSQGLFSLKLDFRNLRRQRGCFHSLPPPPSCPQPQLAD